jgi:anti-sigma B factor antagonist
VENHFRVEVQTSGSTSLLKLSGELDLASATALDEELERVEAAGAEQVIIDLRELEFMDSTGLSVLVRAHQRAEKAGVRFGLVKGPPQVQRLLGLTGVADRVSVADAPEELR